MTRLVENLNPCNQEAQEIRIELNSVKENSKPKEHKKQGNKNKKKWLVLKRTLKTPNKYKTRETKNKQTRNDLDSYS